MSVYVDELVNRGWRLGANAHMIADTLEELHAMARRIGLKRAWFQSAASAPHYDLTARRRAAAVKAGAVELDRHDFVAAMRRARERPTFALTVRDGPSFTPTGRRKP